MAKKETKKEEQIKQSTPTDKNDDVESKVDQSTPANDEQEQSADDNEVKEEYGVDFDKKTNSKGDKYRWYIINGASGQENRIANLLETRVKANELEDDIPNIVVPTQEKIVIKKVKQTVEERIFPGYILVKMVANDDTLHLIRNTDGVIGFIGSTSKAKRPSPLSEKEVESILAFMKVKQPAVFRSSFIVNDAVKVEEGPFKEFVGTVQEVNEAKGQVTVLISMFGREVPVQLDFLQVTKNLNMAKEIATTFKLLIPAGKANPAPPLGPMLGQNGIDIQAFCSEFNSKSSDMGNDILPVVVTVFEDRSFKMLIKQPTVSGMLLKKIGKPKGSANPSLEKIGKLKREDLREIAERKLPDLNTKNVESAMSIVAGTAKSLGIDIIN